MRAGYIPSEPIRKIVRDYVDNRDMSERIDKWGGNGSTVTYSAVGAVADEIGISERNLRRFLLAESHIGEMPFSAADDMLTGTGLWLHWYTEPELSHIYMTVDLSIPDPKPIKVELVARSCDSCGETYTPRVATQIFCNPVCRKKVSDARNRGYATPQPRDCLTCGTTYTPIRRTSRFCSKRCMDMNPERVERYNQHRRERRRTLKAAARAA